MIEIPRAAVTAGEIAKLAEFFSFGTNDLTQMTFGYSRDDAERNFLVTYVEAGHSAEESLPDPRPRWRWQADADGRRMMAARPARTWKWASAASTAATPNSIEWCHMIGNNYVSCSPFRVPIARLAAAHYALKYAGTKIAEDK